MTPTDKEITPFKDFMFSEDDKVTIRFLDDTKKLVGQYSTSHYGTIKELTPLIQQKNKKDWGVFFLVNPSETQGTEDKDVLYARALFVDIDNGELPTYFPCKPSYISSREGGGGYHVYWVLESPETDIEKWRLATKALIKFYHSDKSASNPARILRVPGTLNHKLTKDGTGPKYGIIAPKYSIVEKSGLVYDINTILTAHTDQDALYEQAVRSARAVFPEGKMKEGDGRHHALIKAVYILNDYGVCGESAFKIVKKIVAECFEEPISDDKVREYVSAQKTAKGEKGQAAVDRELAKQAKIERAESQLKDWYFVRDEEAFYTHGMITGYSMFSFNALFASICGESNTAKFAFLHNVLKQYACRVYAPSEGAEFPVPGGMAINKYTPTDLEPIDAVPQWFLDHAAYIIPDEKERNIFLDTYAYLLQNPGKKVRYATLIIGGFRTGKSSFAVIFDRVFGSSNVVPVDNETLGEK